MCKSTNFRTPFDSQHVKGLQTLVKSAGLIAGILALFANTLTANDKYSLPKSESFPN